MSAPVDDEGPVDLDALGPAAAPSARGEEQGTPAGAGPEDRAGLRERLTRWPATAPGWVRGPGAVLAAAALAAALAGALSAHQARERLEQRVAARTALLGLSVGAAEVQGVLAGPAAPAGAAPARDGAQLAVVLVNRGEQPVEVALGGLHVPDPIDTGPIGPVEVAPGSTSVVRLPLLQDCADLPAGTGSAGTSLPRTTWGGPGEGSAPQEWLTATVTPAVTGADPERVRLPVVRPSLGADVGQQLVWACRPPGPEAVLASPVEVRADGRLVVRASNDSERTMLLVPQDAPGTTLVGEPPLPAQLEPGTTADVVLGLEIDCARVASAGRQTHGGGVDLLVSPDDGPAAVLGSWSVLGDPGVTATWADRQIGATCGPVPAWTRP